MVPTLLGLDPLDTGLTRAEHNRAGRCLPCAESTCAVLAMKKSEESDEFGALCMFLAHVRARPRRGSHGPSQAAHVQPKLIAAADGKQVAPCYSNDGTRFGEQVMQLLSAHAAVLAPGVRKSLVQALALLRSKDAVASAPCVATRSRQHQRGAIAHCMWKVRSLLRPAHPGCWSSSLAFSAATTRNCVRWCGRNEGFPLETRASLGAHPGTLRDSLQSAGGLVQLYKFIVSDIRAANAKHKNNQLNRTLQNFMFSMLADEDETAARKSLDVMIELYKRRVWCVPRVRVA